jgi:hypothetical protein
MKIAVIVSSTIALITLFVAVALISLRHETGSLRAELLVVHQEIAELKTKFSASLASLESLEKRRASLVSSPLPAVESRAKKESAPLLAEGSYTRESGAIVYSSDAKVRIERDVLVSSPAGVMVSDENQKIFVGDIRLEKDGNVLDATDAVIDVEKHTVSMKTAHPVPQKPNSLDPTSLRDAGHL